MRRSIFLLVIGGSFAMFLWGYKLNSSMPVSTKSSAELGESDFREKIKKTEDGDCDAMIALGDHFFFGLNNSYGAIFWYEKALKCGRSDAARYLKELYKGLGLLNSQELKRLDQEIEKYNINVTNKPQNKMQSP